MPLAIVAGSGHVIRLSLYIIVGGSCDTVGQLQLSISLDLHNSKTVSLNTSSIDSMCILIMIFFILHGAAQPIVSVETGVR